MKERWWLEASEGKKTIDENGNLSEEKNFIYMGEREAFIEAKRRARKYIENGSILPRGRRFFLTSGDGARCICFHNLT